MPAPAETPGTKENPTTTGMQITAGTPAASLAQATARTPPTGIPAAAGTPIKALMRAAVTFYIHMASYV